MQEWIFVLMLTSTTTGVTHPQPGFVMETREKCLEMANGINKDTAERGPVKGHWVRGYCTVRERQASRSRE